MSDVWCLDLNTVNAYCWYKDAFTKEELTSLENLDQRLPMQNAQVGGDGNNPGEISENIRKTKIAWIRADDNNAWIYQRLTDITKMANDNWFTLDLRHIESLQYTVYYEDMFYEKHVDTMYQSIGLYPRKLSFTMQLSDPSEYEGGDVLIHNAQEPFAIPKERGTITFFPSYTLHEVKPVTKGIRKCLVGWVHGPRWK